MRFSLPSGGAFDIPDDLWAETGMNLRRPAEPAYRHPADPLLELIPIRDIEPVIRSEPFDFSGLHRDRFTRILEGLAADAELPPIEVHRLPGGPFTFGLRNGYHRFYASAAAGFESIPARVLPYFVFEP
jgi:hypothetical protein